MNGISIETNDRIGHGKLDPQRIENALQLICQRHGIRQGVFSIAIVGDREIRDLHRRFLQQDTVTDVLSFLLEQDAASLEGEVVVNGQLADRSASACGWLPADELLLYVIHGALHLVGFDDLTPTERDQMLKEQREVMRLLGYQSAQLSVAVDRALRDTTCQL